MQEKVNNISVTEAIYFPNFILPRSLFVFDTGDEPQGMLSQRHH